MNKYQRAINQIAKDDVKASFIEESDFRKARSEVRAFVKEMGYGHKSLLNHKNFCREMDTMISKFNKKGEMKNAG